VKRYQHHSKGLPRTGAGVRAGAFDSARQDRSADRIEAFAGATRQREGTEASAATAVTGGYTTSVGGGPEPFEMRVDWPFLFALRDRETGTLLFVGQVVDAAAIQE